MQAFRPDDHDLTASAGAADAFGIGRPGRNGAPLTRGMVGITSDNGAVSSGIWESEAGTQDFRHGFDEWVYILEGEAHITIDGETRLLRAGDAAFFPADLLMTWTVPHHVRKVWVQRRQSLPQRVARRLRRIPVALDLETRRRVAWSGALVLGGSTAAGIWAAVA